MTDPLPSGGGSYIRHPDGTLQLEEPPTAPEAPIGAPIGAPVEAPVEEPVQRPVQPAVQRPGKAAAKPVTEA